mgnify:CR=1 FL=1
MSRTCRIRAVVSFILGFSFAAEALAEEVVFQEKTVLTFEDDTIEGDLTHPDGQYLESRKRLRHQGLIRIRKSFRREILKSIYGL